MGDQGDSDLRGTARGLAYEQACASYEAITEFRARLLGLLPLATGTGAFLLLQRQEQRPEIHELLGPIGLLGFVVTVGLFAYELRGMQRCARLEVQACALEERLRLGVAEGPFKGQPERSLGGMLGPPAAGLIIYLATAFTWLYIAGFGFSWWVNPSRARWLLLVYAVVLAGAWVLVWRWLGRAATGDQTKADCYPLDEAVLLDLNARSFKAEDERSKKKLGPILADDFTIVRANWQTEDKQQMLDRIAADTSGRVREVYEENVKIYGNSAVVTSHVTLKEKSGEVVGRYWNTKMFAQREGSWNCITWQVATIP